jgi:NAD(P)-dependent dehydrogenase (short-subunit alcohol dehydrogenase family)
MTSKLYAVIAGVGPGTGAALAHKFATKYNVILLARREESYAQLVSDIKEGGGVALGIPTDVSSKDSVEEAFRTIGENFGKDSSCAVRITFPLSMRFMSASALVCHV